MMMDMMSRISKVCSETMFPKLVDTISIQTPMF